VTTGGDGGFRFVGHPAHHFALEARKDGGRSRLPALPPTVVSRPERPPPRAAPARLRAGTDGLETPEVFRLPAVVGAGGLAALKDLGKPAEILRETKARLFAA
jgi:hypothetical protein